MQISIIGTGNVATVFGRLIKKNGHQIIEVFGRNSEAAFNLANELQATPLLHLPKINDHGGIILMAVTDNAIPTVLENIFLKKSLLVHTAGSVSINVLENNAANFGVLWPMQSLRKEKENYAEIPLVIDANNDESLNKLENFSFTLSKKLAKANDMERQKLHLAAVVVNNFSNYIYTLASNFCEAEKIPFSFLQPLMQETLDRLLQNKPNEMQTGPAIRQDFGTIEKHLNALQSFPELRELYQFFSQKISNHYHPNNKPYPFSK